MSSHSRLNAFVIQTKLNLQEGGAGAGAGLAEDCWVEDSAAAAAAAIAAQAYASAAGGRGGAASRGRGRGRVVPGWNGVVKPNIECWGCGR